MPKPAMLKINSIYDFKMFNADSIMTLFHQNWAKNGLKSHTMYSDK